MTTEIQICLIATAIAYFCWRQSAGGQLMKGTGAYGEALLAWHELPATEKRIPNLEAVLAQHPEDLPRRLGMVLTLPEGDHCNPADLRRHALELIARLPHAKEISRIAEAGSVWPDHEIKEITEALQTQLGKGFDDTTIHANLATIQGSCALPLRDTEAEAIRTKYGLPADAPLRNVLDATMLDQAIDQWESAIGKAGDDPILGPAYTIQLITLLCDAGRKDESIRRFAAAPAGTDPRLRAQLLLRFARHHYRSGRSDEAVRCLESVLEYDSAARGSDSIIAATLLGQIALDRGDIPKAVRHIHAATEVDAPRNFQGTGMPVELATRLLDHDREAVATYCRRVLTDFNPDDSEIADLLKKATA